RNGTLTGACDFVVGRASACEEFLHVPRRVGHGVGDERQRRGEPHTGAGADLRAEHALGLREAGSSGFVIGFGVPIRAADRVVDGGVVQIRGDLRVGDRHELEPRILDLEVDGGRHDGGDALRESASPCWIGHVVRSLLWPPAGGPSCGRDQSSGPYSLRLTDSRSSSGRWATSRSHLSSISPTCARSGATTATPTCARRYRSCSPVSAADTPNRRSSAITGRIADLFCLSECTSPSSRSSSSAPRYIRFSPRGRPVGRPVGSVPTGSDVPTHPWRRTTNRSPPRVRVDQSRGFSRNSYASITSPTLMSE